MAYGFCFGISLLLLGLVASPVEAAYNPTFSQRAGEDIVNGTDRMVQDTVQNAAGWVESASREVASAAQEVVDGLPGAADSPWDFLTPLTAATFARLVRLIDATREMFGEEISTLGTWLNLLIDEIEEILSDLL